MLPSPEYRNTLDMEIWYRNLGDDYVLWLMAELKDSQDMLEDEEEREGEHLDKLEKISKSCDDIYEYIEGHEDITPEAFEKINKILQTIEGHCETE